jgi:hypothetical protein
MDHFLTTRRPNLNACSCTARVLAFVGWVLLIFTAISLCTMPVTQHLWTWDHFLHGGHDFELGMLMVLSLLSLVLVLAKSCKQCLHALLSAWHSLAPRSRDRLPAAISFSGALSIFLVDPVTCPASGLCNLPLQI